MSNERTPSIIPPDPSVLKARYIGLIEQLIACDNMEAARVMDKQYGVGYFKAKETPQAYWLDSLITSNATMLEVKRKVAVLAADNIVDPVLVSGPTGTGKELLAKSLHGKRAKDKFIDINCAGMPEHLLESELFGHVSGSFTGATKDKLGLIRAADKGTLFMDEIGEMPLSIQAKLLRVLQDKRVRPVGAEVYKQVDFRLVCATHRDLREMVKLGTFRKDLYQRLSTFELHTLALVERPEDIPLILKHLNKDFPTDRLNMTMLLNNGTLDGNVRSLERIVRRWEVFQELPS